MGSVSSQAWRTGRSRKGLKEELRGGALGDRMGSLKMVDQCCPSSSCYRLSGLGLATTWKSASEAMFSASCSSGR